MHPLRRKVPSLTALIAFESAGRHESFTRAADELGVSQAAISRRIKTLEQELGCALFVRARRRVILTDAGKRLFNATTQSFDTLADAVAALGTPTADLTVAASVAFAHFRLLPALSSFRAREPNIGLRVISEDVRHASGDPQIDISVRYGRPPFRGMTIAGSLAETVVPVCAPNIAEKLAGRSLDDLTRRTDIGLIESANPESSWLVWSQWLDRAQWSGQFGGARLQFTSYSDAIYAAIDGQGVALGWTGLLERPLSDGRLVPLDLPALTPEERHYILIPERKAASARIRSFVHWMEATLEPG